MKNLCTKKGAQIIEAQLKSYWKERGYQIKTKVVPTRHSKHHSAFNYDVRSDMINGFPKDFRWSNKK
jgi:hypothetical protein